MQNELSFSIDKSSEIDETFRVRRIIDDFDLKIEHSSEHFEGKIQLPKKWNIGVIVGASGSGKTTIAAELFGDKICTNEYSAKSVIDDMPKEKSVDEITRMFYAVGFGSTPSWLKPYSVLSNGEKMRVDLANAMLKSDFCIFDEFTSVVDRNVAQTMCLAVRKAIAKTGKKFVAISCHYDVLDWLEPDWCFDTSENRCFFGKSRAPLRNTKSGSAAKTNGKSLGSITI